MSGQITMLKMAQKIERLINVVSVLILSLMILLVFFNVVLRYGFSSGISVSVELSRFIFVWVCYLGSILALGRNQHLSVPLLYRYLPNMLRNILSRVMLIIMIFLSIAFAYGSFLQMMLNWSNSAPISGIPMAIFYLAGLVCAVSMIIVSFFKLVFSPESLYKEMVGNEV